MNELGSADGVVYKRKKKLKVADVNGRVMNNIVNFERLRGGEGKKGGGGSKKGKNGSTASQNAGQPHSSQ
jgi:Cytosolic carboxypeptidase N-terminal domain